MLFASLAWGVAGKNAVTSYWGLCQAIHFFFSLSNFFQFFSSSACSTSSSPSAYRGVPRVSDSLTFLSHPATQSTSTITWPLKTSLYPLSLSLAASSVSSSALWPRSKLELMFSRILSPSFTAVTVFNLSGWAEELWMSLRSHMGFL